MERAVRAARRLRAFAVSKTGLFAAAALLVYAAAGFLAAPWLIKQQLPKIVAGSLNARATVAGVRVNPFLFRIEIDGLAVTEPGGAPALDIGRLTVDFETSSLLRRAWTFREIRLDRPVIHADLDAGETLNFSRMFAKKSGTAPEQNNTPGKPPRLLLQHVAIGNGAFRFTDRTLQPEARAQFDPVNFEIHDVSTLPDHDGNHRLTARLPGGGDLRWQGEISLSPLDTRGSLRLKDGKLATLWRFVQDHLTLAEPQGSFDIELDYHARYREGALDLQTSGMAFRLKDLLLAQRKSDAPLAKLSTLAIEGGALDLRKRTLAFGELHIADGEIRAVIDESGRADWARLVRDSAAPTAAAQAKAAEEKNAAAAPWQISLPKIGIGLLALSLTDQSRAVPLRLALDRLQASLGLDMTTGTSTQVRISDGSLKLSGLALRSGDDREPVFSLGEAGVEGAAFDLQQNAATLSRLYLAGGRTRVIRDADGTLNLAKAFAARRGEPASASTFKLALDRSEISNHGVTVADHGVQPPLAWDLEQLRFTTGRFVLPFRGATPVELGLRARPGGTLKAKGSVNLQQSTADIRAELADLALAPLEPLLRQHTTLTLASGKAGADGRITWNGRTTPASVGYAGNAVVSDLDLKLADSGERLFSWQRFAAEDIAFDSGGNRLSVAQLHLVQPYAKLAVYKDRSTNLAAIRRPAQPAAAATPAQASVEAAPMAVGIDRVSIERGNMDFSDASLVLPFSTYIKSLGGSVSGLSSSPDSRASLKFEGRVEEYGLARAEGTIQPFAPKKFTDIMVAFRNVELVPMSAYTATFAGRKIASGKLSLDLQYKLDNGKLAGDNKLLLDQFTLGERVESPTAASLPLDLAIALLKDSDGRIDLAVPVSGDVDNPEFSYGHLVWQAIRTVLTRIVTAPFRALGALFGSGSETLGDILFDPGSARILPTEYEKLRRVADGLQKRPQLKLVVQGRFHRNEDSRALRAQAVRAELAAREGLKLAPGEDPGPVGFDSAKTQRALENMLEARAGSGAAAQFAAEFRKASGREAPRVNAALALVGRGAGDRGLYVAMHQRLVELQPLQADALAALGQARADAIVRAFTTRLKFDAARVGSKAAEATEEADKAGVPLKLSFEALK